MTAYDPLYMKAYRLPDQIERTITKLARLKVEAESIGLPIAVLKDANALNEAWEREITKAKLEAKMHGNAYSMGPCDDRDRNA